MTKEEIIDRLQLLYNKMNPDKEYGSLKWRQKDILLTIQYMPRRNYKTLPSIMREANIIWKELKK